MTQVELPVAVDVMGADGGIAPLVEGAIEAVKHDGAKVILVGNETGIKTEIERLNATHLLETGVLAVEHAAEEVEMSEKPADAARKKKQSSMRVACDLVAAGRASAALSAGNSGAMLATSLLVFGRIDGVKRPAIAVMLPTKPPLSRAMLLDAGANTDAEAIHLFQWGVLGATYMKAVFGLHEAKIGVVANGEEDSKGTPTTREALRLLRESSQSVFGHVEGRHLGNGDVAVFVTDGFTGNIILKTAEGVFSFIKDRIKLGYMAGGVLDKLGGALSKPMFGRMGKELDPREVGASPLLGLLRPAFIAHGSSDAYAVRCGVRSARTYVQQNVGAHLEKAIAQAMQEVPSAVVAPTATIAAS